MSNIDKLALREVAKNAKELGNISRYTKAMVARLEFKEAATPDVVLALLDELEAAEKRIAELEAREVKLPELKMLRDYLAEVTHREREDILVGVRLEFFRALEEAGVKAAAAGKGE
ncbi:ead/Ea22-like family protein [Enterobacter roggenkampii]|uniref:ead/Ea22-like family protein n=1 Tax=Enterobacter roggenkampii TaxID=1812935 RepID=UPI00084C1A3B|nr:ead/Ea22-like family protein [Enterobacter roggenkampii]AOP96459.1 hypothetical protein BFV67_15070 [Enterobacter roggenkampii]QWZ74522.1 ead/Ea22-like family protein [Enterobacter roggenkampii]